MFQVAARRPQHTVARSQTQQQQYEREHGIPGKRTLTEQHAGPALGDPDFYNQAIDSAMRELDALRVTALPNYVAIRRKTDLAPLQKQIELTRVALQVRYLMLSCNAHVYALEKAQSHIDPMVQWLRARLDIMVARAVALGVYDDARDMIPQRYFEEKKPQPGKSAHKKNIKTHEPPPVHESVFAKPAHVTRANPKSGNTPASPKGRIPRAARGTGAPTGVSAGANASPRVRPGFRPA